MIDPYVSALYARMTDEFLDSLPHKGKAKYLLDCYEKHIATVTAGGGDCEGLMMVFNGYKKDPAKFFQPFIETLIWAHFDNRSH